MLTEKSETVLSICRKLAASGAFVLHGGNREQPLSVLYPRQANDAAKIAGNFFAVYATTNPEVAILNAVLNRAYLSTRLESWTVGYRVSSTGVQLKATDNVYQLFVDGDPDMFSDGFVYALDLGRFSPLPGSECEFFALEAVRPRMTFKIPGYVGAWLFRVNVPRQPDTVVAYNAEEKVRLAKHVANL